jgi:hypothetical protein
MVSIFSKIEYTLFTLSPENQEQGAALIGVVSKDLVLP